MNPYNYLKKKQIQWALNQDIELFGSEGDKGVRAYTSKVNKNLFEPLSDLAREQIESGDGGELTTKGKQRLRMQAVHSSSVLPVNVFQHWQSIGNFDPIASACGFCNPGACASIALKFEEKFPIMEDASKHPNLDVTFVNESGSKYRFFAVESKFTETYGGRDHGGLKDTYFRDDTVWKGMLNLRQLAETISPDDKIFDHLHAAQLIKHILGLAKVSGGKSRFRLLYLHYDVPGRAGVQHQEEIDQFKSIVVQDGIKFHAMTYQELILKLADRYRREHSDYIRYLVDRYL
jgi:hypothetical protein